MIGMCEAMRPPDDEVTKVAKAYRRMKASRIP
jgi:hypothetical protein